MLKILSFDLVFVPFPQPGFFVVSNKGPRAVLPFLSLVCLPVPPASIALDLYAHCTCWNSLFSAQLSTLGFSFVAEMWFYCPFLSCFSLFDDPSQALSTARKASSSFPISPWQAAMFTTLPGLYFLGPGTLVPVFSPAFMVVFFEMLHFWLALLCVTDIFVPEIRIHVLLSMSLLIVIAACVLLEGQLLRSLTL